jgi:hypothetical protein
VLNADVLPSVCGELLSANSKELMRRMRAANCRQFERRLKMSTQEIIRELAKLNRDELAQVDLKLHELLEEKIRIGGRSWGEALLEVAGTVEGLPPDYAENHDHYLHGLPRR